REELVQQGSVARPIRFGPGRQSADPAYQRLAARGHDGGSRPAFGESVPRSYILLPSRGRTRTPIFRRTSVTEVRDPPRAGHTRTFSRETRVGRSLPGAAKRGRSPP